jgi:RimJ/RimL family protein N-acetyltransferase
MTFPEKYRCLKNNIFEDGDYKLIPIRFKDRIDIMNWRNEQMYHLRQSEKLTIQNQDKYFNEVVSKLFYEDSPNQILFSFLKNDKLIGYGGLVHINWIDKNAEISFIMNTELQNSNFEKIWSIFLKLIEKTAFHNLNFKSIYTYAFDLRPNLYPVLEKNGLKLKSRLKNHLTTKGEKIDVLIHEKINPSYLGIRNALKADVDLIFKWSNDDLVRDQSFNTEKIIYEDHVKWFNEKLNDTNNLFFIVELNSLPIGLVRFHLQEDNVVIGILIDENYRGKNLSVPTLILGCEEYFKVYKKPIIAFIKKTNFVSVRLFKKAGFEYLKDDVIQDIPCYVYELINNENVQ